MRVFCRVAVASSVLAACGGDQQRQPAADSRAAPVASAAPTVSSAPVTKGACPVNGQWSECAVFDRLEHAGMAPRRDTTAARVELAPLNQAGTRLLLNAAELDVFLFPDPASRQRAESKLDRSKFIEATDEPTLRGEATLIRNENLLAVLRSRNDHQRERVSDALSAGPPQPHGLTSLPPTRTP